ncbi:MAG: methyltransferase domain-containing protein [Armatimonadetes bacterium]|nr:methyltransferase domain-containing protein [Armatimonadota bacterium]
MYRKRRFDLETHYPEEMDVPEVRHLCRYLFLHDTHTLAESSLLEETIPKRFGEVAGFRPELEAFSYGETPPPLIFRLLREVEASSQDVFLDLGSGCGGPTLLAAHQVARAVGVDLVPAAVEFARSCASELGLGRAEFREEDLLETDLGEATILYCSATAVSRWLRQKLEDRWLECRPGARIITAGYAVETPGVEVLAHRSYPLSWTGYGPGQRIDFFLHRRGGD